MDIAKMTDYAVLRPEMCETEVVSEIQEAVRLGAFSVCVRPADVALARALVNDSETQVCTVVGFPHGANTIPVKAIEAADALANGADEIDYVLNISAALDGRYDYIMEEAAAIRAHVTSAHVLKVIFETHWFTPEQVRELSARFASEGIVDFVKTSTGFAGSGATPEMVDAMLEGTAGTDTQVKASGGISSYRLAADYVNAGVTRFGMSKLAAILDGNTTTGY